jgi:DNA gyrase subunit A
MIADPDIKSRELCKYVKGPDFPTGGEILNSRAELRAIYDSGQGAVRLRGQYLTALEKRRNRIIITSIPYTADKSRLVAEIADHIVSRRLPQATDVRDESTDVVRIVVEIKPDASAEAVMAYLFKHTGLQINFNVNMTALTPTATPGVGQPARLTLRDLCRHFLDFRLEVVTRRLQHELEELRQRLHILAGFLKLFDNLDRAIKIIRTSSSRQDAAAKLMKEFRLDDVQADAVLETRLYQLARLEIEKIREEQREKRERAAEIERLLKSTKARWKIVEEELRAIRAKYGDKRRTVISEGADLVYDAGAYVVHEDTNVVITRDGWMKRLGEVKDPASTRVREGDAVLWVLRGNTRQNLALFSNTGNLYVMRATNIPATTGYGEPVQSFLNFKDKERIVAAAIVEPAEENAAATGERWLTATARGMGFFFKPDLAETTKNGRRFARLKEGDDVIAVTPAQGDTITAATSGGKVLVFAAAELTELSGAGRGVILMRVDKKDTLIGALCHAAEQTPIAVAEDGAERRFHPPAPGKRAQSGRKALKRFKAVELVQRSGDA